ncbi:MAG: hypothetical protein KGI08_10630, partial [Thaumarchaeota archaeon]|nr:hypothetical protein [Nitrososphaerota archaeon]
NKWSMERMTNQVKHHTKKLFCNYCEIGDCKNCLGLYPTIYCNHDCNYLKKEKLGYKAKELYV